MTQFVSEDEEEPSGFVIEAFVVKDDTATEFGEAPVHSIWRGRPGLDAVLRPEVLNEATEQAVRVWPDGYPARTGCLAGSREVGHLGGGEADGKGGRSHSCRCFWDMPDLARICS